MQFKRLQLRKVGSTPSGILYYLQNIHRCSECRLPLGVKKKIIVLEIMPCQSILYALRSHNNEVNKAKIKKDLQHVKCKLFAFLNS